MTFQLADALDVLQTVSDYVNGFIHGPRIYHVLALALVFIIVFSYVGNVLEKRRFRRYVTKNTPQVKEVVLRQEIQPLIDEINLQAITFTMLADLLQKQLIRFSQTAPLVDKSAQDEKKEVKEFVSPGKKIFSTHWKAGGYKGVSSLYLAVNGTYTSVENTGGRVVKEQKGLSSQEAIKYINDHCSPSRANNLVKKHFYF